MIKNILVTLFSVFCLVANANANIKISPDVVETSIKQYFPKQEDSASALATFNANLESDGSISAAAIWRVCIAGNLNLDDGVQKYECRKFKTALEKNSNVKYSHVCTKGFKESHAKRGEAAFCIDDVFNNSLYGGTQVDLTSAIMLAKEYARVRNGDDSLVCENKVYKRSPKSILARASDDYTILCTSQNRKAYYEFWFDHIGESDSGAIFDSVGAATCKIFNTKANVPTLACVSRTPEQYENTHGNCPPISCETDKNKCTQINQSLAKFGYMSLYDHDTCEIYFNSVDNPKQLKTAFGINNFKFCKGIQVQNTPSLEKYLQEYVAKVANVDASEVTCNPGHRSYTGPGCSKDGSDADDIKTCYVNGEQIDFVFDDINEWKDIHYLAGIQGMECIVRAGGVFDGKHCLRLTKEQCDSLQNENISTCSGCKQVEWDPVNNMCKLKYAGYANDFDKAVKVAKLAGSVLLAVYGGWVVFTAVKAGGAVVVIPVLLEAVNVGGSILEFAGTLQLKGIATEFVIESNNCETSSCADTLVDKWLRRLSNIREELEPAEYSAVNEELARLLKMTSQEFKENMVKDILIEYSKNANTGDVPENVQKKFQELYESPDLLESNKKGFFDKDSWEPEQVLRAVGIGLQIGATLGSAAYSWHQENKALAATRDALNEGYDGITHDPAKREAVKKRLAEGIKIDADRYENKLRAAYQKYAPKNQTYDDFVKMFKNEEEFDKQAAMWSSFEPGVLKGRTKDVYISSPYSTYDPEFAQKMKGVDVVYNPTIERLDNEIKTIDKEIKSLPGMQAINKDIEDIDTKARQITGKSYVGYSDYENMPELKDLKTQKDLLKQKKFEFQNFKLPETEYTQQELDVVKKKKSLENLRNSTVYVRDYEKSIIINNSVDTELMQKSVEETRGKLVDIYVNNDDLFYKAEQFNQGKLSSDADIKDFLQQSYDAYSEKLNIPEAHRVKVRTFRDPDAGIRATARGDWNLYNIENENMNYVAKAQAHELGGHLHFMYNPDDTALGAQKAAVAVGLENPGPWDDVSIQLYYDNSNEWNAFKIGGNKEQEVDIWQMVLDKRKEMGKPISLEELDNIKSIPAE